MGIGGGTNQYRMDVISGKDLFRGHLRTTKFAGESVCVILERIVQYRQLRLRISDQIASVNRTDAASTK